MPRLEVARGDIASFAADVIVEDDGPVWQGGDQGEPADLFEAYYRGVQRAAESGAKTIAVPSMSIENKGYPASDAAEIAVAALLEALADFLMVDKVTVVTNSAEDFEVFTLALDGLFD